MLDASGVEALLRAAAYFASRPTARIGVDREAKREAWKRKERKRRREGRATPGGRG